MLLLSDGAYLEDTARAQHLGGDQWGMMNETGNYPGQPWMWLYTFWYQVPPFSTSENADAQVWALMMVLTLGLILLPLDPRAALHPALDPRPPADLARLLPTSAHLRPTRRRDAPRRFALPGASRRSASVIRPRLTGPGLDGPGLYDAHGRCR